MKIRIFALTIAVIMLLSSCSIFADQTHVHSFSDSYSSDEAQHWYACSCGAKEGAADHVWNDGVITIIPTPDSDGIKTFTCMECGRKLAQKATYTPDESGNGGNDNGGNENTEVVLNGLSFAKSTFFKMDNHLPKTPLTLEAEIYVDPSMSERVGSIFANYIGVRQDWLFEIFENGVPRFYYHDAGGNVKDYMFNEVDVRTGDWVHIAFTFDYAGGKMSVYLDGELAQSIDCTADLAEDITTFRFIVGGDGRSNNGNYFKGQMRSIAAYSDVRTAEELADSAANGINSYADDILLHYVLNPKSGEDDIMDLSPNGFNISKEWIDSHEPDIDYAYSFAVVGDTQWLSKYAPAKMEGIYDWILANQESKKIAHVFGLGDITEDWNTANKEQEWIRAYEYISKMDGKISYSLARGNHDESKYFLKYFTTESYMSQFDGFMVEGDSRCAYMLRTFGQTDYLFLVLDFGISDEMIDWANEVVLAHPNHTVIVTTHGYQAFNEEPIDYDNVPTSGGMGAQNDVDTNVGDNFRSYNNGQQVWDKFLSKHPNIAFILCGHTPFEDVVLLQTEGNHGNVVNQMVIDAQWMDPQKDGVGMVCMFYFSEDGTQMAVEWLSTDTGKYYQEHNQFTLDLTPSLNASAHVFKDTYNEQSHHKACDCGYIYNAEPHTFDGGTLNGDGFMVYSCECGYQRIASASNDPVALELQALLEKYYNGGAYYKSTVVGTAVLDSFFNGNNDSTVISLYDFIMGKFGDLALDLGWNYYDGVYSSVNESTIEGVIRFANIANKNITKVTVEELNHHVIFKLLSGDDVVAYVEIGLYAHTTLVDPDGKVLAELNTKSDENGLCRVEALVIDGYVAEYDYIILSTLHGELNTTIHYSSIVKWDGNTVSASLKGSGTLDDPYLVESGADLAYIASVINAAPEKSPNFAGKYFKMTNSIDLNGHDLLVGTYTGWGTRKGFYGFFDGNHCTVRGLDQNGSLFGTIENGYLKNLSVYGKISGSAYEATGGIVGYAANGGVLENLTSYVTVNGTATLGGIVGNAENQASTVINCVNYGSVTGTSYIIGGIAGSGGHDIKNCINFGNVTSTANDCVGGIAGSTKNTGKIENCYNYGNVQARGKAAGIAGQANKPIIGCINYGKVNGTWALGGILGFVATDASASITNCVNNGSVTATSTGIGGIFGISYDAATTKGTVTITGCENNGSVKGTWGIGGIAGDTNGDIIGCTNNAAISAQGDLGGIVGMCYGKVEGSTNNGDIVGSSVYVGGIVGRLFVKTHLDTINTTNTNNGTVIGAIYGEIIGQIQ